jgi:glycosyltransferase involved in cell wall biosynthesis
MITCTVAIPVYNRERLVRRAIESALEQSLPGLEVLVIDNCSTDATRDVVSSYQDSRLRLVCNASNLGLFGNLNRCIELAQGEYLRILCSDDRLMPDCLAAETALLDSHPNIALVSTRGRQVDEAGRVLTACGNDLPSGIYSCAEAAVATLWMLSHYGANPLNYPSGVLLRRDSAVRSGGFDLSLKHLGDIDFFLKVARYGDIALVDHVGCEILVHPEQTTNTLLAEGEFTREWFILAERWREELNRRKLYRRVVAQSAACSLWFAGYYLRKRRPDVARRYWHVAQAQGLGPLGLSISLGRHLWMKALLRGGKIRLRPNVVFQPFA